MWFVAIQFMVVGKQLASLHQITQFVYYGGGSVIVILLHQHGYSSFKRIHQQVIKKIPGRLVNHMHRTAVDIQQNV